MNDWYYVYDRYADEEPNKVLGAFPHYDLAFRFAQLVKTWNANKVFIVQGSQIVAVFP